MSKPKPRDAIAGLIILKLAIAVVIVLIYKSQRKVNPANPHLDPPGTPGIYL